MSLEPLNKDEKIDQISSFDRNYKETQLGWSSLKFLFLIEDTII